MFCAHCHWRQACQPRGLCYACYTDPDVRHRYPSERDSGNRMPEDFAGEAPLPAEPTRARPGSEKKLRVLAERAARREVLFHPADAL